MTRSSVQREPAPPMPVIGKRVARPKYALIPAERRHVDWCAVAVLLPLRLVSEANMRGAWQVSSGRKKQHRSVTAMSLRTLAADFQWDNRTPLRITITRIAPAQLDDDNLAGACKATRDGVADWLGVDDRDRRIEWRTAQERGPVKTYGVRIEIREVTKADRIAELEQALEEAKRA